MIGIKKHSILAMLLFVLAGFMLSLSAYAKGPGPGSSDDLTADEEHYLLFMREEEKLAHDTYLLLFDEYGLPIFANIVESEQRHMDAIKKLLGNFGLTDPVTDESVWDDPDNLFTYAAHEPDDLNALITLLLEMGYQSVEEAVTVGVLIEETDIVFIQHAIEASQGQPDIVTVYESLLCGSRNHLRSFYSQLVLHGVADEYEPILDEFIDLATSPMEMDCGGNRKGKGRR